ncbi:MAG: ABC transporter ATP-binding protein [Patescibacteria group bacterium]|jgi:ABC-2 type transport system ATP-binding protein
MATPIVHVRELTKRYGAMLAVDRVSFDVAAGEVFALIGPNGAGKSTTLRMIATLLTPTSGTITVAGHDRLRDAAAVRQALSYLPEEAGAYKNLTGAQYLEFMASLYFADARAQRKAVAYGAEISKLGDRLRDRVGEYSKGMTRKLLLARTVMARPKLAILDEPTSGLDVVNAFEIRTIVKDLAKAGMAVLLSSHNMLEIEFLSDRVSIINKGKILATGTPKELKKQYSATNLEEVFVGIVQ